MTEKVYNKYILSTSIIGTLPYKWAHYKSDVNQKSDYFKIKMIRDNWGWVK